MIVGKNLGVRVWWTFMDLAQVTRQYFFYWQITYERGWCGGNSVFVRSSGLAVVLVTTPRKYTRWVRNVYFIAPVFVRGPLIQAMVETNASATVWFGEALGRFTSLMRNRSAHYQWRRYEKNSCLSLTRLKRHSPDRRHRLSNITRCLIHGVVWFIAVLNRV